MKTIPSNLQLVKAVSSHSINRLTPQQVHERSNLSTDYAAKAARVHPRYLKQVLRNGGAPFVLASRLASVYNAPISVFLFQVEQTEGSRRRSRNARRGRNPRRATSLKTPVQHLVMEVQHGATGE